MKFYNKLAFKNLTITFHLLSFLLTLVSGSAFSQSPYSPTVSDPLTETWRWRLVENLTAKGVRCMSSDVDGNMWFGLNNGLLVRFNPFDTINNQLLKVEVNNKLDPTHLPTATSY